MILVAHSVSAVIRTRTVKSLPLKVSGWNWLLREEAVWVTAKSREVEGHRERIQLILDELRALEE
jgi:hypothetical protein